MDVVEIVGFGLCWAFVAVVMLWAVLTEDRPSDFDVRFARPTTSFPAPAPDPPRAPGEWVLVETVPGATDRALGEAQLVLAAWLAAWGMDETDLPAADVRTEQVRAEGGAAFTRVLIRASALPRSSRHRQGG